MTPTEILTEFLEWAMEDPKIAPVHMSLFMGLLFLWQRQGMRGWVEVSAKRVMPLAKISGTNTYHRVIRQLHRYGYLRYEPSYDPDVASRVYWE